MLAAMETGLPDTRSRSLLGSSNVLNGLLVGVVPIPAIAAAWLLYGWFPTGEVPTDPGWSGALDSAGVAAALLHHPIVAANLLFFVFVNLAFWGIALIQRSSWLIDPYWTLLPPLLAWLYLAHPLADPLPARVVLGVAPLVIWSARLTYNYFRREAWRFGLREDWRFARMRRERPGFWWEQLFVVYVAQQGMLVGLSLPFWAIAFRPEPLGVLDGVAFIGALSGIGIAAVADTQLDTFMRENARRADRGEPRQVLLDVGLWRYSRHPNYFGEQLFWWSIAGFGIACGEPWVALGSAFNSCVLAGVTVMTERRMLEQPERREAYAAYRRRTSVWVPWRVGAEGAERSR
jgi:steroid 5-alpha reductase family enzyme